MSNRSRLPAPIGALLFALCAAWFASTALADPSGRVAYLSDTQGVVSYSPSGQEEWVNVVRNRPLIRGDRLWTDNSARAEFQVGSSAIRIAPNTSVEMLDLDDRIAQVQLAQGTLSLNVRRLYRDQVIEIDTPLLAFTVTRAGRYRIDVDPAYGETTIVVWEGAGEAYGQNANFPMRAGDTVRFYAADLSDYEIYGMPLEDDFDLYSLARDQRFDRSGSLRYVDDDVVGYADLDDYGSWSSVQSYGNVWFPSGVSIGWAPYRDGFWVWQEPWGWTWVDNAPWGFAPSHYGRWVYVRNSWGWVPGPRNVRPIYAPALVAFVGGSGWNLSISLGGGASPIGWFPLGPREVYVPSYHASYDYFNRVNVNNTVINNTTITNVYNNYSSGNINVNQANYANRNVEQAITVVPSNVFENAQPVGPAAIRVDRKALKTGETMRIAPIAPSERSVMGAGKVVKAHPAPEVFERRVVAHNAPPPADSPFANRAKHLQEHPGQGGLEPATVETAQSGTAKAAKNMVVIGEQKNAVDVRSKGSRRAAKSAQPQQLDRSIETVTKPEPGKANSNEQAEQQEQAQRKADSEKRAAQQQQHQADLDQQAAQQQQDQADTEKRAAKQRQHQADLDQQAAQQQQDQVDTEKRAAKQRQHQADLDQQAAQQEQVQLKADSDKRAAQQQQRQADYDQQAAQQQQRQADSEKRAAQQQQRQADYDQQAAQQQQRQADSEKRAAQQQQRQADYDQQAAQQQQRQSEYDRQSAQQQQGQPEGRAKGGRQMDQATEPHTYETTGQGDSEKQQPRNRAQSECEREARKQGQDESLCQDEQ